jgi:hypothetical protein
VAMRLTQTKPRLRASVLDVQVYITLSIISILIILTAHAILTMSHDTHYVSLHPFMPRPI